MNLPASISSFRTSSCQRRWSISLQAINIKMKFLSILSKASWHQLFSQFSPRKHWIPLHQSFIPINLVPISLFPQRAFFSPSIFDLSFSAEVHEYCFTLHCGCVSIDQEIRSGSEGWALTLQGYKHRAECNNSAAPGGSGRQQAACRSHKGKSPAFLL